MHDRPAHADSPDAPVPDGRTVQPGHGPVTTTGHGVYERHTCYEHLRVAGARLRQATRRCGHFPDPDAAQKVLYLVIQDHKPNRKNIDGKTVGWKAVINTLKMYYDDRINIDN
jgi:hypothetical protein